VILSAALETRMKFAPAVDQSTTWCFFVVRKTASL
jgi:hypothetical protein